MELTTTIASAIETAPLGAFVRHGCPTIVLGVRSYSAPSNTPFALVSVLYWRPLPFGPPPLDMPIHGSTATASPMLIAPLREPAAGSEGVHMSGKSHGFSGSRWPPSTWFGPASATSEQPLLSSLASALSHPVDAPSGPTPS